MDQYYSSIENNSIEESTKCVKNFNGDGETKQCNKQINLLTDRIHYGENEDIFYNEAKSIIDRIHDGKASSSQKDELMKFCLFILSKHTRELVDTLQNQNQVSHNFSNLSNQYPSINLIYYKPPPNLPQYAPPINLMPRLPYYFSPPNQMQMVQYPQYFQQPANYNLNSLSVLNTKPKKSNDKKKSKDKHHHHHHHQDKKKKFTKSSKNKKTSTKGTQILYDNQNYFKGIIQYLRKKSNGNIESEVKVTSSSSDFQYRPQNVIDYSSDKLFETTPGDHNPWLCIEFLNRKVAPKSYVIESGWWEPNNWHPRSWAIEGSNDNNNWTILDKQDNCDFLNGEHRIHLFDIKNKENKEFKFLRIRQTGPNWFLSTPSLSNKLVFQNIEFYGTLI